MDSLSFLTFTTPLNIAEEKEKFFKDSTYHPHFIFRQPNRDYLLSIVNSLEEKGRTNTKNYFKAKLFLAVADSDFQEVTTWAKRLFNKDYDYELAHIAKSYVSTHFSCIPQKPSNIEDVAKRFEEVLEYFEIPYSVEVSERHGFNCRPSHTKRTIYISRYANMQYFPVEGMVKHEMSHVIRGHNQNFLPMPQLNFYIRTEEGLACYFQDFTHDAGDISLYQHSIEYLATEVALAGSLRDTFNFMTDAGFNKELAWQRSIRHKFGFSDTKKPGDIMKPSMYFANEMKIKDHTKAELLRFLSGKLSYSQLGQVDGYQGPVMQEKIQEYYKLY